ncbi:YcsE-related riboflavin metabolism phosphatase [Mesomycoplasma ovipneumoniae]|uniref:YcsE-related riboflavin metabolism phosphatase n=1 Tax=Mesomycoplasma ovipneumoniae TaxID=29562 RepID=UPI0021632904|nr:HAD family hydrolase [Mesomycoplasma ovipneumoniae]UVO15806.1 Cof-type HAD-IIB family hydrolase [Mesomycoplasma ovipneumoniae]
MNKFKIFATDIDDTIVPHGGQEIPEKIDLLFAKLKEKNIITTFVTGRDFVTIGQLINAKNVDYFIGANGAFIFDFKKKQMIYENPIKISDFLKIVEFFDQHKIRYIIMDSEWIYTSNYFPQHSSKFLSPYFDRMKPLKMCNFKNNFHIFTVVDDQDTTSEIQLKFEEFAKKNNLNVSVSSRWSWGFFIGAKNVDKMQTLEILAKMHNVEIHEIIAFGDSRNDTKMLKNVGFGVAMENSTVSEVKEAAKDIAPPVDSFGVYLKAIELKIID